MKQIRNSLLKLLILASLFVLFIGVMPSIYAANEPQSGYCGGEGDGTNLAWTLDTEGLLTISGTGKMMDEEVNMPWDNYAWSIEAIVIGDGVANIGNSAFEGCYNLKSINIANGVTSIGDSAFGGCWKLTDISIPNSVTSIGKSAFYSCRKLESIIIPSSVTSINGAQFSYCYALSSIIVDGQNKQYDSRNGCNAIIDTKTNALISGCQSSSVPYGITKIGTYAFLGCSKLTSIVLPSSVSVVDMGAFRDCAGLANITISNGLETIGNEAFDGCASLTHVEIPNSVNRIGANAFWKCTKIKDITIPDSITSIEIGTFNGCSSLTDITIPNRVTSIDSSAFSGCSSLVSITVPNSVTSIGSGAFNYCSSLVRIAMPSNLKRIEDGLFNECSSLKTIIIPDSVKEIGKNAFLRCKSLGGAYFCGDAPSVYNDEIFYKCNSTFCIYYTPGTSGWTDSDAYNAAASTWNGYLLKTWDGKTIPEEAENFVPKGKYCIRTVDENGMAVSDATVTWDNSSSSTDQDGNAFFDFFTQGNPVIQVSKQGYLTWTNENTDWQKSETRFERVILYPESYGSLKLKSAKLGKCDLLTQTKVLNLRNDGALIGDLNSGYFDLTCAATDSSVVTGYALYQNTKKIAESAAGSFTKLNVRDFVKGGGCFVRVIGANGQTMDTHINLQFAKNSVNEDFKFELKGKKISFTVSDDIPWLGGGTFSFDMPLTAPIFVSATQDKLQFGINFVSKKLEGNNAKTEEEQLEEYKETIAKIITYGIVKETDKKLLKNFSKQSNKTTFFKTCDVTVCGYAEADIGSKTASGNIVVIIDMKALKHSYNTVMIIPVTLQIDVKLALETSGSISYRFDTETWNGNISMKPSIKLTPFFGAGVSGVWGLGGYGQADLAAKWNILGTSSGFLQTVDLTGELGIKGYIGPLEAHKAFAHQTWHLYTANTVSSLSLPDAAPAWDAAPESSDFEVSDLSYLASESAWSPVSPQIYGAARATQLKASYQTLLQNTYRNAQPVMVSDGSALYAAFVRADVNTGARYIALTKFDGTSWSEPVRVDTNAILDNAPQLCTDGQTLWLAYARTTQEPGDSLVSYAQNQTIVVGTFDSGTLAFTEQKTYQSDDYMHLPALSCANGTPVLAWAESAVTDASSVVAPKNSTVYLAKCQNGAWTQAEQTAASAAVIDSICIGARNAAPAVAYTADGKLYCGGSVLTENVTGRAVYGKLPGAEGESFLWNTDGALHDEAGTEIPVEGMGRDFVIVGDSIYFNQSNGASANLAAVHYDAANDHWSAPILLIGDEQYLENLNAAELNGKTYALGMHTTVTISEDDVNDAKDLVWTQILPVSDLKLSDISFDADALVPGETLPVTLTVTNSGDHTVSSLTLTADSADTAHDCQLLPGESAEFTVNITCPSEKKTVTFEVQEPGQDDYTPEDNTSNCTVGSADAEIELALIQIGSRKLVQAAVINRGLEAASGSVLFTDSDGQALAERTFQNLTYGDAVIAEYEPDSFADLYGKDVLATVVLQQDERNTLNNSDSVPVLFLASTQITAAYQSGNELKAEVSCAESAKAVCAFYDQYGRMLNVQMQPLQAEKVNTLSFEIKDARAKTAKIFVLGAATASPICAAWNVTVE